MMGIRRPGAGYRTRTTPLPGCPGSRRRRARCRRRCRAAALTLSSELRRSDTTNHLRGSRCSTLEVVRARVCRTRRAAGFRAVHEAATFRIVASAGSGGHLLAVLLLRFLGVLRARPKHMITWGELKLAGPNGARAAWFRLRERRGGTHRHGNRVSMSCARCSQRKTLFPEATSCTNSRPPIQ